MTQIPTCIQSHELQLKLRLAALVPDLIEVTDLCNFKWRQGDYYGMILRETEWDHVLRIANERDNRFLFVVELK